MPDLAVGVWVLSDRMIASPLGVRRRFEVQALWVERLATMTSHHDMPQSPPTHEATARKTGGRLLDVIRRPTVGLPLLLLLALVVRLPNLNDPLLGWHSWRQADSASMARYFFRSGEGIGFPQVAWSGAGSGYVESEFPLYQFLLGLLYRVTGEQPGTGRLFSIVLGLLAVLVFFLLVRKTSGQQVALLASAFFALLPLNVFYSRVVMPEPLMLLGMLSGVFFFLLFLESGNPLYWLASWVGIAVAAAIKPQSLALGLVFAFLAWRYLGKRALRRLDLWLFAVAVLGGVTAWFYHAHRLYEATGLTFGVWGYGTDKWGNWELVATWDYWQNILFKRLGERYLAWFGLPLALYSLIRVPRKGDEKLFDGWLVAGLIGLVVVGKGNQVHEYYQLPLTIPLCFYLALAVDHLLSHPARAWAKALTVAALVGMTVVGIYRYASYLEKEDPSSSTELRLATALREITDPDERVVVVNRGDPTSLYLADRRGWIVQPSRLSADVLRDLGAQGARVIGVETRDVPQEKLEWILESTEPVEIPPDSGSIVRALPRVGP